jgi:hypothetical protein
MVPEALANVLGGQEKIGGPDQNRTDDLLIANETLSQLSYGPTPVGNGREYEEAASPCQGQPGPDKARTFNLLAVGPVGAGDPAGSLASRPWRG